VDSRLESTVREYGGNGAGNDIDPLNNLLVLTDAQTIIITVVAVPFGITTTAPRPS